MKEKDLTRGPIRSVLISFAIPIITSQLIEQSYYLADRIIISKFADKEAFSAVGLSLPIIFLVISAVGGALVGAEVILSHAFGKKDYKDIKKIISNASIFLLVAAILTSVLGILATPWILRLVNTPRAIFPEAKTYLYIYFLTSIGLYATFGLTAFARSLGDSKTPLYFMILASVLNIALDLLFVAVYKWGIAGAAWASGLTQIFTASICFFYYKHSRHLAYPQIRLALLSLKIFKQILAIGIPASLHFSTVMVFINIVQSMVNSFGENMIAAYTAIFTIEELIFVITIGIGESLGTFASQNIGAKQDARVLKGLRASIQIILLPYIVLSTVLWLFPSYFIKLFLNDPAVIDYGVQYLKLVSPFYTIQALVFLLEGFFEGTGSSIYSLVGALVMLLVLILGKNFIFPKDLEHLSIWYSIIISWFSSIIVLCIIYLSNKWQGRLA